MRFKIFCIALITSIFLPNLAFALGDDEWILCSSCSSSSQFESYATARIGGFTGNFSFYVANPNTGQIQHMEIVAARSGTIPARVGGYGNANTIEDNDRIGVHTNVAPPASMTYTVLSDVRATAATEHQFLDIAKAAQNSVVIRDNGHPFQLPDNPAFSSFSGRDQNALRDYFWNNGASLLFSNRPDSSLFGVVLTDALEALQVAYSNVNYCYIFNNGDLACFTWPYSATAAAPPVPGTAVNSDGEPIDGGGSGYGFNVYPGNGGSYYGPIDYSAHGAYYLFCARQGGKVISCWVEWITE